MPKVHRSLDRRVEYMWKEDGTYSESGPFFAKYEIGVEECYRLALAWIDAYPMIRAAFVKKYPDQADSDDVGEDDEDQDPLGGIEIGNIPVEEFTRQPSKRDNDTPPERLTL